MNLAAFASCQRAYDNQAPAEFDEDALTQEDALLEAQDEILSNPGCIVQWALDHCDLREQVNTTTPGEDMTALSSGHLLAILFDSEPRLALLARTEIRARICSDPEYMQFALERAEELLAEAA